MAVVAFNINIQQFFFLHIIRHYTIIEDIQYSTDNIFQMTRLDIVFSAANHNTVV